LKYKRAITSSILGIGVVFLTLALSWHDLLPGGWRLRGLVLGPEARASWTRVHHAQERLELFVANRNHAAAGSVLFLGSSTIERFPFDVVFPGKPCVGRGINGDTVLELSARLEMSVPSARPAGILVAIGGNDLRRLGLGPGRVAQDAAELMDELGRRYPQVPVTFVGLFGETEVSAEALRDTREYNLALQSAAESRGIGFLSTLREPLVDSKGRLVKGLSADRYHLNDLGYQQLGLWILADGGEVGRLLQP
jgi:lysophospholipase L1-like esterase